MLGCDLCVLIVSACSSWQGLEENIKFDCELNIELQQVSCVMQSCVDTPQSACSV